MRSRNDRFNYLRQIVSLDAYQLTSFASIFISSLMLVALITISIEAVAKLAYLRIIFPRQILSQFDLGLEQLFFRGAVKGTLKVSRKLLLSSFFALVFLILLVNGAFAANSGIVEVPLFFILILAFVAPIKHLVGGFYRGLGDFRALISGNLSMIAVNMLFFLACVGHLSINEMAYAVIFIEIILLFFVIYVTRSNRRTDNSINGEAFDLKTELRTGISGNIVSNCNGYFINFLFASNLSVANFGLVSLLQRFKSLITSISVIFLKKIELTIYEKPKCAFDEFDLTSYRLRLFASFLACLLAFFSVLSLANDIDLSNNLFLIYGMLILGSELLWRLTAPKKVWLTFATRAHAEFTKFLAISNILFFLFFLVLFQTSANNALIIAVACLFFMSLIPTALVFMFDKFRQPMGRDLND